ncbi:unnamed protein product [Prorocentrum cordatum]|uniref:Uncharacterized protein n=1 Tax=Prorocentrum cordatum TaxID=2364126 RepID=A0ABN9QLT8_9DINO|nr:unnamed protein product [Polarella glacialis]
MAGAWPEGLVYKNTFLDCESPWVSPVTVERRAKSDPSSDRFSASDLAGDGRLEKRQLSWATADWTLPGHCSREQRSLTSGTGSGRSDRGGPGCVSVGPQQQDPSWPEPANLESAAWTLRQEMEEEERSKEGLKAGTPMTKTQRRHLQRKCAKVRQASEIPDAAAGSSKNSTKVSL